MSSEQAFDTTERVDHTGSHEPDAYVQPKFWGDGSTWFVFVLVVQMPAWYTALPTC